MPREETRFQVLTFSDLTGTPVAGVDLVTLRAGSIVWDVMVIVNNADGAGRTMDIQAIHSKPGVADITATLINNLDTSPNDTPANYTASRVAATPTVPAYGRGGDTIIRAKPSASTTSAFRYTVVVIVSSVLS